MAYTFTAHGHDNILAEHKNTLEITKDRHLTKNGDCIVGVAADFSLERLRDFSGRAVMELCVLKENGSKGRCEKIDFDVNPDFASEEEIVLRLGDFSSSRTYGINCSKSAKMLDRKFVDAIASSEAELSLTISQKNK